MAKMFYTMDETKAALGKSEDEIRQLAREGKLREFRDGPRLMFKTDQVEALKAELSTGGGDQIGLSAGDTHAPLGLMDSKTGSGTGTAMNLKADTAAGTPSPAAGPSGDTAAGMDVGLSGSLSGSIGGGSLAGGSLGGSLGGSMGGSMGGSSTGGGTRAPGRQGVNVLGGDDNEQADPMAQTHITPPKDQISLEGVGSGSGLLDLTRETDDTSLGAALLDEISPGGKRSGSHAGTAASKSDTGSTAGMSAISPMELPPEPVTQPGFVPAVAPVEINDAVGTGLAVGSIAAILVVLIAALILIGSVTTDNPLLDSRIPLAKLLDKGFLTVFVGGFILVIIFFAVGLLVGKSGSRASA